MPVFPNPSTPPEMLKRPTVLSRVDAMLDAINKHPDACYVPAVRFLMVRNGKGPRLKASFRHLLYYRVHSMNPVFGMPNCKCTGCINPSHQRRLSDTKQWKVDKYDAGQQVPMSF